MRATIEIDQKILEEIIQKTDLKTKKEVVDAALKELLRKIKLRELADLRGKISWEGNLDEMRATR